MKQALISIGKIFSFKYRDIGVFIAIMGWQRIFQFLFGLLLFGSTIRFWLNGWIESLYITPTFHFKFYGFEWVDCPSPTILYLLFVIQAISALGFALNFFPNYAIAAFFLSFTYVELIDVTPYLNHYYLVSVLCFTLIFYHYNPTNKASQRANEWVVLSIKMMLSLVYFYGGIAKLNRDWLLNAQPLRLWLVAKGDIPYLGYWLLQPETACFAAWFGCIFDLCIPFLLWNRRTTLSGYILLSIFHISTAILFPIGIFPWVMMVGTLLFFEASQASALLPNTSPPAPLLQRGVTQDKGFGNTIHSFINLIRWIPTTFDAKKLVRVRTSGIKNFKILLSEIILFVRHPLSKERGLGGEVLKRLIIPSSIILIQILLPLRQYLYKENRLWTEQGFRFAWNIMLIEKRGLIDFKVTDPSTHYSYGIDLKKYLTDFQITMMSTQPDLILQFAHHLANEAKTKSIINPKVTAECYVSLNGRRSQLYFDPDLDLTQIYDTFAPRFWLYPLGHE